MANDCVLILSGGTDSTTLLWDLLSQRRSPVALTFNYGQRHDREIDAARHLAVDVAGVPWRLAQLGTLKWLISQGSQTGTAPVPEGHYTADSMSVTVVPNRNMIMLAVAVGHAITIDASEVYYAAHAGDHAVYPDCRLGFVAALNNAICEGNKWAPLVLAPYLNMTKAQIIKEGLRLRVPYGETWSCYKGHTKACGRCGTCVERLEAFARCGIEDPLDYTDRTFWKEATASAQQQ